MEFLKTRLKKNPHSCVTVVHLLPPPVHLARAQVHLRAHLAKSKRVA